MLAGIIGDVIGSVYEAHQWQSKDLNLFQADDSQVTSLFKEAKWVRKVPDWTDDTLCTLALYSAYIHNQDPKEALLYYCNKYKTEAVGFGGSFMKWLENPVPYESFGNGSLMRVGFIPFLKIPLEQKLRLGYAYTAVSHNHPDSFESVRDFIFIIDKLGNQLDNPVKNKQVLQDYLTHFSFSKTIEDMHIENKFELNAKQTLFQSIVVVLNSNSMEEVLRNCFYIGGDSDTMACIACNLASTLYRCPEDLLNYSLDKVHAYPELSPLVKDFQLNYWI